MTKEIYALTEMPAIGTVPKKMHAWTIRQDRFGEPKDSFQKEIVDVPSIKDDEVLVYVMAAGVNYNNVWAAQGIPVDVIAARQKAGEKEDFHIGGSDASGIVFKVGAKVKNVKVGDEVVTHCGIWDQNCPQVKKGIDPMFSPSFRIWGYETNFGSFAQFARVQDHQCLPKPKHLTWEQAASYMLVGATAYRMLMGWDRHAIQKDDVCLIWGGAGGLGSMAIQIAKAKGAVPVAVVSDDAKIAYCKELGAKGCINRKNFDHWGMLPHWKDTVGYANWFKGARQFGKAIWDVLGEKKNPRIVFEHPGEATIPTSIFVCEPGGMVTICAGTTGYNATVDLRYLWMRQKRLQGSHFANDEQSHGINQLVLEGKVDPCLSRTFTCDALPESHQLMFENKHPHGNMSVLIGSPREGLGRSSDVAIKSIAGAHIPARNESDAIAHPQTEAAFGFVKPTLEKAPLNKFKDETPVREIMHTGVISCKNNTVLDDIAKQMVQNDIHALLVVDAADEPVGIVSQTDIVLAKQNNKPEDLNKILASHIMTPNLITCTVDSKLSDAVSTMARLRIHRLIVTENVGGKERAVGVLSMTDIIRKMI